MNNNLEQLGISLVMQGNAEFAKGARDYGKQVSEMNKNTADYGKTADKSKSSSDKAAAGFKAAGKGAEEGAKGIGILGAAIEFALSPITLIITAVTAAGAAIGKLGLRGAEVRGVETAFANLISPILKSGETIQSFVDNLRQAAGDTISQVDLLRSTNLALAGTSGALRETFARALPQFLEIARVQAAATGESVQFLFDSLVRGVKRGSPLIIDNTGLVLDLTAANQALADQLGITVDQMTEEQKTIALINATVAAGGEAIEAAGGIQVTAATRLATIQSLITNTIDNIAKGVEPLVNSFLGFITPVFSAIEQASRNFGTYVQIATGVIDHFTGSVQNAFGYALKIIDSGSKGIETSFVGRIAAGASQLFGIVSDSVSSTIEFLAGAIPNFARGGAMLIAALGNSYLAAANQFIFPVVVQIATFIADFLTGFSPAKRGPLSRIDEGAAGLAQSWAGSFAGVFVPSAQETAAEVDAALGDIGKFGINRVEKRLSALDMAIRPFQERLALAKAQFEALQEPAKAALDIIDKQLEKAVQGLATGDERSAELVRNLNLQRAAWEQRLSMQDEQLDKAKLNLAIMQAQQAQERTLLNIQKERLGKTEAITKTTKDAVKAEKVAADKAPTGGKAEKPETPAAAGGMDINQKAVDDFLGKDDKGAAVNQALLGLDSTLAGIGDFAGQLGTDFMAGLNAGGELDTALGFGDQLSTQFDRIANSNPVQGITGAFGTLTTEMTRVGSEAVEAFLGFFTDPAQEGSIPYFINDINTRGATAVFGDLTAGIQTWIQDSIITPIQEGALVGFFDPTNPEGFYAPFINIGSNIVTTIGDLRPYIESAFNVIGQWVRGETEGGGLPTLIQDIVNSFSGLPSALFNVLQFIGLVFFDIFVAPMVAVIDQFIAVTNDFLNGILESEFMNFLRTNAVTSSLFQDFPSTVQIQPLSTVVNRSIFLPVMPPEIGHAETGGLFTGGLLDVHKDERIFSAEPMGVMNAQFVRAMDTLSELLVGSQGFGMGLSAPATNVDNRNIDNSVTVNSPAGLKQSAADVANRIAVARIFGV